MKQGDIFQTNLRDGRFGAVKVLKIGGRFDFSPYEFYLLGVTTYIGNDFPTIEDSRLDEILVRNFTFPKGTKVIGIYCGVFPADCKYVGNKRVTVQENELEIKIGDGETGGFPSCGNIQGSIGYEALIEWRYKYDNEAFMNEVEISRQQSAKLFRELRNKAPKKMISEDIFWGIISKLDWQKRGDDNEVLAPAVEALSKLKVTEIKQFEEALAYKLYQLDTIGHAKNMGKYAFNESNAHFSVDMFLYARCAIIANGETVFRRILKDSTQMAKDIHFEPILYLSQNAYILKTGKDWDYDTNVSYETYSNTKGWE